MLYNGGMNPTYNPVIFNPLQADNDFLKNLREALQQSYDAGLKSLENQRTLDQSAIMNRANKAGVMFSNIPQRMKIQYDTNTYMPNQVKLNQTYQTGLDSLRNAGVDAANQVAYYQQMIDHYNTMPTNNTTTSTSSADQIAAAVQDAISKMDSEG